MKFVKYIKYISLFIYCYCVPTLSEAQKLAGFQGKRGVIEVGLMPNLLPNSQVHGTIYSSFAITKRISIGVQYNNSLFSKTGSLTTYGLSGEWAASKYTIAPYGRFWAYNFGIMNYSSATEKNLFKGYYFTYGFFDRSIWRPLSLTWGSEVGLYYLKKTKDDGYYYYDDDGLPLMIRLFVRVGLVW
jgi:hypothetical protein